MQSTVTVTKTKEAEQMGQYTRTTLDEQKASADFLLINVCPNIIRWSDGRQERLTDRQLAKAQAQHPNWKTDF